MVLSLLCLVTLGLYTIDHDETYTQWNISSRWVFSPQRVMWAYPSADEDPWLTKPSVDKTSRLCARSETGELAADELLATAVALVATVTFTVATSGALEVSTAAGPLLVLTGCTASCCTSPGADSDIMLSFDLSHDGSSISDWLQWGACVFVLGYLVGTALRPPKLEHHTDRLWCVNYLPGLCW